MSVVQLVVRNGTLVVDRVRCHGCQACMVACSLIHEGQAALSMARIHVRVDPLEGLHEIGYCHQCKRAPCAQACPQEAIQPTEGGYWAVEEALCTGCGACAEACPFGAIVLSPGTALALICDTCDGEPTCVAICPSQALSWKGQGGQDA